jgi:hypothetical protein
MGWVARGSIAFIQVSKKHSLPRDGIPLFLLVSNPWTLLVRLYESLWIVIEICLFSQ